MTTLPNTVTTCITHTPVGLHSTIRKPLPVRSNCIQVLAKLFLLRFINTLAVHLLLDSIASINCYNRIIGVLVLPMFRFISVIICRRWYQNVSRTHVQSLDGPGLRLPQPKLASSLTTQMINNMYSCKTPSPSYR